MVSTLIVVCYRCGGLLLAKADQKTRTCPYCGSTVVLEKARTAGSAENAQEAAMILRRMKTETAERKR